MSPQYWTLAEMTNTFIQHLIEHGFSQYFDRITKQILKMNDLEKRIMNDDNQTIITMKELQFAIIIWVIVVVVSFLAFMGEYFYFTYF